MAQEITLHRIERLLVSLNISHRFQLKFHYHQITSTPTLKTKIIDDRRKKQKKTESPLQVQRYELPTSNEEMEETPTRKRKSVASYSTVLDL